MLRTIFALVVGSSCCLGMAKPQRIVSTNLSSDEILYTLLESQKELHRLIAISPLAEDPKYSPIFHLAKNIPKRASTNMEALLTLKPDLIVFAEFNRPEWIAQIKKSNIPFFVVPGVNSFKQSFDLIESLAARIEAPSKAIIEDLKSRLAKAKRNNQKIPGILSFDQTLRLWGRGTFFDDVVQQVGAENILARLGLKGWPKIDPEAIAKMNPDWLVVPCEDNYIAAQLLNATKGFRELKATKEKKIIAIPSRLLFSTSFGAVKAVEILAEKLAQ